MTPQQPSASPAPAAPTIPLSQQPVPTLTAILNTGALPVAPPGPSIADKIKARLRSRAVMVLIGVVGLGAIGAKLFWPEAPKLNVAAASSVKPAAPAKAQAKKDAPTKTAPTGKSKVANAEPLTSEKPEKKPHRRRRFKAREEDGHRRTPAEVEAKPASRKSRSRARRRQAGHRTIGARVDEEAAVAAPSASANTAARVVADPLGPVFIDETNGYSIRFPAGWSIRTFNGEPWVIDSGDGRSGLISIGFSPFPNGFTTESIPPEWIARRIKRRADTVLHGQGYSTVAGKRACGPSPPARCR
jgi:hypothetical protein